MNHPYSGAASYIYANEHRSDDESEAGVYTHMKSFIPIAPNDSYRSSSMPQSPSTTHTNLPRSLTSSMIGFSASKSKPLSNPSNNRNMRWGRTQDINLTTPRYPRSDGNGLQIHSTWDSVRQSRPSRELDPQSSFVDFREQQRVFRFGERKDTSRGWRRNLQRRVFSAFQMLRRLWTRGPAN